MFESGCTCKSIKLTKQVIGLSNMVQKPPHSCETTYTTIFLSDLNQQFSLLKLFYLNLCIVSFVSTGEFQRKYKPYTGLAAIADGQESRRSRTDERVDERGSFYLESSVFNCQNESRRTRINDCQIIVFGSRKGCLL